MHVCFPILSAWALCSTPARFVGEIEISILPSSHVSPPASFLPGLFDARGAVAAGPVSLQDGDLFAQVAHNLLGSSQDPPDYSWTEKANTRCWSGVTPRQCKWCCVLCAWGCKIRINSWASFCAAHRREVSKKSFPNWYLPREIQDQYRLILSPSHWLILKLNFPV